MLMTIILIAAVTPSALWKSSSRWQREEELMLMTLMMIVAVKPCALSQSLDRCPWEEELMLMTMLMIAAVQPCARSNIRQMSKRLADAYDKDDDRWIVKLCALSQPLNRCLREDELMLMTIVTNTACMHCAPSLYLNMSNRRCCSGERRWGQLLSRRRYARVGLYRSFPSYNDDDVLDIIARLLGACLQPHRVRMLYMLI